MESSIIGNYNSNLAILSVLVAIISSYAMLSFVSHITTRRNKHKNIWIAGGAIVMGGGIWSMHFIGMLALNMPTPVEYHLDITIYSLLIPILISALALRFITDTKQRNHALFLTAGILIGSGIASMHYTGMAAMHMAAKVQYDSRLVLLSILIAIIASTAALYIAFYLRESKPADQLTLKLPAALMMGFAIAGMHYTGMEATSFMPAGSGYTDIIPDVDAMSLAIAIAAVVILTQGFSLVALLLDHQIIEKETTLEQLTESEKRLQAAQSVAQMGDWEWDILNDKLYWSDEIFRIFGLQPNETTPSFERFKDAIHLEDQESVFRVINKPEHQKQSFSMDYRIISPSGSIRWFHEERIDHTDKHGQLTRRCGTVHDITGRKLAEKQMNYLATHDPLTKLPNRTLLIDRLQHAKSVAERNKNKFALLFIDIDEFKQINDEFGHKHGDTLLCLIAQRCMKFVRDSDTVARFGGDEFIIVLSDIYDISTVATIAKKLVESIAEAFILDEKVVIISCSIGIAIFPDDQKDTMQSDDTLIHLADAAMYQAKKNGKGQYQFAGATSKAKKMPHQ